MKINEQVEIVKSHTAQLSEHFDSVQIFCTKHTNNGTTNIKMGSGDWFARYGLCKYWVKQQEENCNEEDQETIIEEEDE